MTGRIYLLRGEPVVVLAAWRWRPREAVPAPPWLIWWQPPAQPPRNVRIGINGKHVVRPFRGLRRWHP